MACGLLSGGVRNGKLFVLCAHLTEVVSDHEGQESERLARAGVIIQLLRRRVYVRLITMKM